MQEDAYKIFNRVLFFDRTFLQKHIGYSFFCADILSVGDAHASICQILKIEVVILSGLAFFCIIMIQREVHRFEIVHATDFISSLYTRKLRNTKLTEAV